MAWPDDLIELAKWAMQTDDLRYRFMWADTPAKLSQVGGIVHALETSVVLSIFEAAMSKGYAYQKTVDYEVAYPHRDGNPPRADLGFKENGKGTNWAYIEAKCYAKGPVEADIAKLQTIKKPVQRWILVYRVRRTESREPTLAALMERNFVKQLEEEARLASFSTFDAYGEPAECEIYLRRVRRA